VLSKYFCHVTKAKIHETEVSDVEIALSELAFVVNEVSAGSYSLLIGSDACKPVVTSTVDTAYALHLKAVQKPNLTMQLICMRWFPIWSCSQVTKKLSNSVGSSKSKHNTDHAVHKTDYSDLCSKLHRDFYSATLNGCSFMLCNFPGLQRPDMPEFLSVSATEGPSR